VTLVIVHYHLRPGGIRRIIELAAPYLVRAAPQPVSRIILATSQRADDAWHDHFAARVAGVRVEVFVEATLGYLSEQRRTHSQITVRLRTRLQKLLADCDKENCLVWAHNLGVGRNFLLARELAAACRARNLRLVSHHHDWWFDNRWNRWREMQRFGTRTLSAAAETVFPPQARVLHAAINHADANVLTRHLGKHAVWLPNLTDPSPLPPASRVRAARHWLQDRLSPDGSPVWLLPCRTLRRKNIAEAVLLTRWLRPEAWLVVTGAASSADEICYLKSLGNHARRHHWRLRLGVLAGNESHQPAVSDLLAASEAVLLTSIQEGFGLPYLEAAAARRPLIARRLPNISPDLHRFGFRFPQAYDEILVAPELFDWPAEQKRQRERFHEWRATMPAPVRAQAPSPLLLAMKRTQPVPFSRLTLIAQLEILAHGAHDTWQACARHNPFLESWRQRAATRQLQPTPWPRTAKRWLSGVAYARRLFAALDAAPPQPASASAAQLQADFIAGKLDARNLYPLLWTTFA